MTGLGGFHMGAAVRPYSRPSRCDLALATQVALNWGLDNTQNLVYTFYEIKITFIL